MFTIIFAFTFIVINYIVAETPVYLHICKNRDSTFDQCAVDNIMRIIQLACKGIPKLDMLSLDPFFTDKLVITDSPNSKIVARDLTMTGHCEVDIKHINKDLDKLHFEVELSVPRIYINGTLEIDVRLLVPISSKEPVYITTNHFKGNIITDTKVITKNGKRYMYISKMKANFDTKDYDLEYGSNNTKSSQLNQILNNFVGNTHDEIFKVFKPAIEETFVKHFLPICNAVLKQYTFEELFPDLV